jgi:hypothetical protein
VALKIAFEQQGEDFCIPARKIKSRVIFDNRELHC